MADEEPCGGFHVLRFSRMSVLIVLGPLMAVVLAWVLVLAQLPHTTPVTM
jgi:hypothetical protein